MQSFPFDSKLTYDEHDNPIYDRAVSSQPLRKLIRELFTTGVMPNPSTNLQVSAGNDGMTVQIAAGFAVIDGGLCHETETRTLEVTAADNTYDRIDTVVLRWNENVDVRTADLYVIAGTPAVNPVRPTLQRNNSIYEIGLADVFITKRVATITNDKITDTRYEAERCGIVSSISKFDTTTLYQQIQADLTGFKSTEQADFLTWYESIRNILDENAAGHLQNEIDAIRPRVTTNLLNPTLKTTATNGVTCTANGDGTYTVTGAVSSGNIANFVLADDFELPLNTPLKLVGCPQGGGTSPTNIIYKLALFDHVAQHQVCYDYGNGSSAYTNDGSYSTFRMHLAVYAGAGTVNLTFKPMITTALTATYDDYVQYSGDGELNENVAKHEKDITQLNTNLTASDNLKFQFTKLGNDYGYKDSNGNFHPFRKVQASKAVTASTSALTVTPDSGYDGLASVTVNPQPHTATRTAVTSNGTIDLGNIHNIRYVPVNVSLSYTTLWSNPNPRAEFGNQDVAIPNMLNYKFLRFDFWNETTNSTGTSVSIPVDYFRAYCRDAENYPRIAAIINVSNGARIRAVSYVSDTAVRFSSGQLFYWGNLASGTYANFVIVPVTIYGIN